ncbi:hypothetical protein BDW59DRAFT_141869 [Aspergillus cavernicola]|uniref:Uncharacterized protein n=1 Tax=Aspergillus cavernicola TaxID=176166 RepID=A0ABR4IPM3_9EURO
MRQMWSIRALDASFLAQQAKGEKIDATKLAISSCTFFSPTLVPLFFSWLISPSWSTFLKVMLFSRYSLSACTCTYSVMMF